MKRFCLVPICLLALSTASWAKPFAPKGARHGADYAEIVFELGLTDMVGMGTAKTQQYRISETEAFWSGSTVKIFTWAAKKPKSVLLPVGRKAYIFARMTRLFGAPGISYSGSDWCTNGSGFTPQPNGRYRVVQAGTPDGNCMMTITDLATAQQPAGIEPLAFKADLPTSR